MAATAMTPDVVGREDLLRSLAAAHARERLPQSLLIHGARGVGKQTLALWVARMLVCENPAAAPCGGCRPCGMQASLEHPDVHWYFPLPRPTGVSGERLVERLEDARIEALATLRARPLRPSYSSDVRGLYLGTVKNIRQRASMRASMAEGPVFIVGDAELLVPQEASPEAANALLKLLEEPPDGARFILTSSEPERLLPTIRSRTVPLHLPPLDPSRIAEVLTEALGTQPDQALWAARLGQGAIGRALGFLPDDEEQGPLEALRRQAFQMVRASLPGPRKGAGTWATALSFPSSGARTLVDLFSFMEEWLRDLGAVASGADDRVFNFDAVDALREIVGTRGIAPALLPLAFPPLERARSLARGNVNPQLIVGQLLTDLSAVLSGRPCGVSS